MPDPHTLRRPLILEPAIQRYPWGHRHFIQRALGLLDDGEPVAEAWFGAHPSAPATVTIPGSRVSICELIARAGLDICGAEVRERFGGIPYLMKLLAAERPLSIQVHPNRAQAGDGHAREDEARIHPGAPDRCYRDAGHKPELLVALTPFYALCGFRPQAGLEEALAGLTELHPLLLAPWRDTGLEGLLAAILSAPAEAIASPLRRLLCRLSSEDRRAPFAVNQHAHWALQIHAGAAPDAAPDRGLALMFLLSLVRLEPGQGVFLPAGLPHAYLEGAAIELMATSDNVLRAGLTSKHVDPEEFLRVVRLDATAPPVMGPVEDRDGCEETWHVPTPEMCLSRLRLEPHQPATIEASGPETLLNLPPGGDATVTITAGGEELLLPPGAAFLLPNGVRCAMSASAMTHVYRAGVPPRSQARDFRGRTPTRLSFGTSGLRGLVDDITDLEAYINTRGFLDHMLAVGGAVPGTPVGLAGDLRPSTHGPSRSILQAVATAVTESGLTPVHLGRIPAPALALIGLERGWPTIMVTGSHIPFDRNGIKFNAPWGEILKEDEAPIREAAERVRRLEYGRSRATSLFDDHGWFAPGAAWPLLPAREDGRRAYMRRYLDLLPPDTLEGMAVVLFQHSAVGRDLVAEILEALGARVIPAGRSEEFVAVDTEAISEDDLATLQGMVDRARAEHGHVDALVSTDGDSDRPLLLGVDRDGRASFVGGDVLGAIVADQLRADAVAVPVSASDLIDLHFLPRGVGVTRTRIGSPWVISAMARMEGSRRVGWEANGGFMTGSDLPLGTGTLSPLPTRDAVLPIVIALRAARREPNGVATLLEALPKRFGRSGLMDHVPPSVGKAILEHFGPPDPAITRLRYGEEGVVLTDDSGDERTLPLDEARLQGLTRPAALLERHFNPPGGFGPVRQLDFLDGVRATFEGGDIAHVRPSGNAPQLRLYAFAGSQERADQILAMALSEGGALQAMAREAGGEG